MLVCSDGLFNELSGDEIAGVLAGGNDVGEVVDALIDRAMTKGGRDNVSAVVADVA